MELSEILRPIPSEDHLQEGSLILPASVTETEGCANKRHAFGHVGKRLSSHSHLLHPHATTTSRYEYNENLQGNHPSASPNGQSVLEFGRPTKDVDFEAKMQDSSHTTRKRKHHHHSSNLSSPEVVRGSSEGHSEEGNNPQASPLNGGNEGVATSCKRVKVPNKNFRGNLRGRNSNYNVQSQSRIKEGAGALLERGSFEEGLINSHFGGETSHQRKIVSKKRTAVEKGFSVSPESDNLSAGYDSSPTDLSFYKPIIQPNSAAKARRLQKMAQVGKKADKEMSIFRPRNSLKDNGDKSIPRQPQKIFNLTGKHSKEPTDENHAIKKRKVEVERLRRKDSSSTVNLEGSNASTAESSPSLGSRSVNAELSGIPNRRRPLLNGNVGEYNKTQTRVSLPTSKAQKSILSRQGKVFPNDRVRIEHGRAPHLAPTRALSKESTNLTQHAKATNSSISIQIGDVGNTQEISTSPNIYQKAVNGAAEDADASEGAKRNTEVSNEVSKLKLKSPNSFNSRRHHGKKNSELQDDSGIPQPSLNTPISISVSSTNDSRRQSNATGDKQPHNDSMDFLNPDTKHKAKSPEFEISIKALGGSPTRFAKSASHSTSIKGDIPPSKIAQAKPRTLEKKQQTSNEPYSFDFVFLKSGAEMITVSREVEPWQLQYNVETRVFDIIANDDLITSKYPHLVLKPDKIVKVTYHEECGKLLLKRSAETDFHSGETLFLVEMHDPSYAVVFMECLQTINHSIKTSQATSPEHMDKIFAHNKAQSTSIFKHAECKPHDIVLLEKKEARDVARRQRAPVRRFNRETSMVEETHPGNAQRQPDRTGQGDRTVSRYQRDGVASKKVKIAEEEIPSQNRSSRTLPSSDAGSSTLLRAAASNVSSIGEPHFNTRASSTRQQDSDRALQSPKQRSPSPIRWTVQYPNWMEAEYWKKSLVFPAEGKKQQAIVVAEDIVRLDAGNFLNDNLIALYLRFLEDRLERVNPELAKRIYFQNTFFYASLTKGKDRSNNINYEAVRRWSTKAKVDIFSYDYIVVPVNENLHWYLAIIYNAPKLLQVGGSGSQLAHEIEEQVGLEALKAANAHTGGDEHTPTVSKSPRTGIFEQAAANFADRTSASPSVTVQVEHMSLDDTAEDWPEPDALPEFNTPGMTQLKRQHQLPPSDNNSQDEELGAKDSGGSTKTKKRGPRRKSMPTPRRHSINEPKIITLDSLGGTHSPTCTNLTQYLICEGRARHGVEIETSRLGMTAKGLPQQSNHCDCGIFLLGYMERFLQDPDNFVKEILYGYMTPDKGWEKLDASELREQIRTLIFKLQREQLRREREQRAFRSKSKKVTRVEAQASESSKSPARVTKSASSSSSEVAAPNDSTIDSINLISPKQLMVVATDDEKDHTRSRIPENSKLSPVEIEDEDIFPIPESKTEAKAYYRDRLAVKRSSPKTIPDESEVANPTTARYRDRKTASSRSYGTTVSSIEFEARSASTRDGPPRLKAKSEEPTILGILIHSREQNSHNQYSKGYLSSPCQNNRIRSQYGSNVDNPVAIDDLDGLEIPESPLQQATPDSEFEDISALPR